MESCLNKTQLLRLGWTPGLIPVLLGTPDRIECKNRGSYRYVEHLYSSARVCVAMRDPRFAAAIERRKKRQQAPARRRMAIEKRYADWRAALPEAGAMMFSLNRYAKHRTCSPALRVEIYELKNRFLKLLYDEGLCVACWEHIVRLEALGCNRCWGADTECDHCDGNGIYRSAREFRLFCFRFGLGGVVYTWHQPAELVKFAVQTTQPPQDWRSGDVEKPVPLRKSQFAMAKTILRWVLDRAGGEDRSPEAAALIEAVNPVEAQQGSFVWEGDDDISRAG